MTRCAATLTVPAGTAPGQPKLRAFYEVRCILEEHPIGTLCYAETDQGRVRRRWDRRDPAGYRIHRVGT